MLDPCAADLVDTVARLCVLRTEDYTLLHTVFKRERAALAVHQQPVHDDEMRAEAVQPPFAPSAAYIRCLTEEVERREEGRCAAVQRWLVSVREWASFFLDQHLTKHDGSAATFSYSSPQLLDAWGSVNTIATTASTSPIQAFWKTTAGQRGGGESNSFQQVYAAVVRQAYELKREDLIATPFAQLHGSAQLYADFSAGGVPSALPPPLPPPAGEDTHLPALVLVRRVHALFFAPPLSDASVLPTAILQSMHPLRDAEGDAVTELSRTRLTMSRHVWLILFFLWCHAVSASHTADDTKEEKRQQWVVEAVLLQPASAFLRSQSEQLEALLAKVRAAHGI